MTTYRDPLEAVRLGDRVALVTGGSRGIGAACACWLARLGAAVAVNYRSDADAATQVVETIEADGGKAQAIAADLGDAGGAEELVASTLDAFGRLDILVNNAGIWNRAPIDGMPDATWQRMIDVNLTGTMRAIRAAVPTMKAQRAGRVINISSTAGQRGEAEHAHYAASKGAVIALTKSLATELAGFGILTNCVAPGWVETDMSRAVLFSERRDSVLGGIPLRRMAAPDEIAGAVAFLASDWSSYLNGEVINVNGGNVLCG